MDLGKLKTCSFVQIIVIIQSTVILCVASESQAPEHTILHNSTKRLEFALPKLTQEIASISNATIPVNIRIEPLRELNRKIYVRTGTNLTIKKYKPTIVAELTGCHHDDIMCLLKDIKNEKLKFVAMVISH